MKFPTYQELSKDEQIKIYMASTKKSILVTGPPGTGKTVLALYRSQQINKMGENTHFLVYNKPLSKYVERQIIDLKIAGVACNWHRWLGSVYEKLTNRRRLPLINNEDYNFNWDIILEDIYNNADRFSKYDHIVIDEGQDFPRDLYRVFYNISKHLSIFIDESQSIFSPNATINDIKNIFTGEDMGIYPLSKNYRNTKEIADIAKIFYIGRNAPKSPDRIGNPPRLIVGDEEKLRRFLSTLFNNKEQESIGIFFPLTEYVSRYYNIFKDFYRNRLKYYYWSYNEKVDMPSFGDTDITFLTYQGMKGLEFDNVIIFINIQYKLTRNDEDSRRLFYVMSARARNELLYLTSDKNIEIVRYIIQNSQMEAEFI